MSNPVDPYITRFLMHRGNLLDLLEAVPAEKADFAPWEGAMSFHKLADHMNGAASYFAALVNGTQPVRGEPSTSYADALERLKASTQDTVAMLKSLTPEQLASTVTAMGGRSLPVGNVIDYMIEHDAHHKGQAFTMARIAGVEAPKAWVKWPS